MNKRLIMVWMAIALLLGACGFQLRGTGGALPALFAKTYVVGSTVHETSLERRVKELLVASGGGFAVRDAATALVKIGELKTYSRQIAKSGNNLLKEYERTFSTTVTVVDAKTQTQLGSRELSVTRNIQLNDNQVLAGEEQSHVTQNSAEIALTQSIIRYLKTF